MAAAMTPKPAKREGALPSATEVYEMIREAAYYRAEKRGFAPGLEADDWVQAEAEVMERIRASRNERARAAPEDPDHRRRP